MKNWNDEQPTIGSIIEYSFNNGPIKVVRVTQNQFDYIQLTVNKGNTFYWDYAD